MTKQEFEQLSKSKVTDAQYRAIESIYMAAPNVDKELFCREYGSHRLDQSETVCDMAQANGQMELCISNLKAELEHEREVKALRVSELEQAQDRISRLNEEYQLNIAHKVDLALVLLNNGLEEQAVSILGHAYVISLKCCADMELSAADKAFIAQTFGKNN